MGGGGVERGVRVEMFSASNGMVTELKIKLKWIL